MSIQLANRIKVVPVHDVSEIENGVVTLKSGKVWYEYYTENELEFREEQKDELMFSQKLSPAISMVKADMDKFIRRQLIVTLFDSSQTAYIWGSLDNGVRFTVETYPDRYALEMSRASETPIF